MMFSVCQEQLFPEIKWLMLRSHFAHWLMVSMRPNIGLLCIRSSTTVILAANKTPSKLVLSLQKRVDLTFFVLQSKTLR